MLNCFSEETFVDGVADLSFSDPSGWASYTVRANARFNAISMGDALCGPLISLHAAPPFGREIDPEKGFGEELVHMHPSDGLRLIVKGDFRVGRDIYEAGDARLQAGAEYYGPEAYGPTVAKGATPSWLSVTFLDKRGARMILADPAAQAKPDKTAQKIAADIAPVVEKIGVPAQLDQWQGYTGLCTSLGVPVRRGYVNVSVDDSDRWRDFEGCKAMVALGGDRDAGPVIVVVKAEPGSLAIPALRLETEAAIFVTNGACMIGGKTLTSGDIRLMEAGAAGEDVRAGPEGCGLYVLLGDRRALGLSARSDQTHSSWRDWLFSTVDGLREALSPVPQTASA